MNFKELTEHLPFMTVQQLRHLVRKKEIPFTKKGRLIFDKDEIDQWFEEKGQYGDFMTIDELIAYLPYKFAKVTIYQYKNDGKIPFHKFGKNLLFKKSEINQWLKTR